jgi:hypothetical protein
MRFFVLSISILLSSYSWGQKDFCKSRKIEKTSQKIINNLTAEDFNAVMKITKDSAVSNLLYFSYESKKQDLKPIKKFLVNNDCYVFDTEKLEEIILEYTYFKMHKIDTCLSDLTQPYITDYIKKKEQRKINLKADSINGVFIPKDIFECFHQINLFWNDSTKLEVKKLTEKEFLGNTHFGLGMWMRNNWGLWSGSRLSEYFNNLEIYHPDDMSGIILTSYYRFLIGEEVQLNDQVKYYKDYWKKAKNK